MNISNKVKIVVFVPESHADAVRKVMAEAGAGKIGNYTSCSFSSKGVGRFLPQEGANPAIGEVGKPTEANEERIEMVCPREVLTNVIAAIRRIHPYEEVAFDIYQLESY
jgi:hypothetical protein